MSGDRLPAGVALVVFDAAVNSGPDRAARWLQAVLGVATDGVIGPVTMAAVHAADPARVIRDFSARRLSFLRRLGTWSAFGRGWSRRVRETEAAALASIRAATPAVASQPESTMTDTSQTMTQTKSMLASRTLWANAIGLASVLYVALGGDASGIDAELIGTRIAEVIAGVSFLASSAFRIVATRRLQA
jgi:lysozyme family protein